MSTDEGRPGEDFSGGHVNQSTPEGYASPSHRALPQWAVDLLIDGVGDFTPAHKIWGRAVSIAMCMQHLGRSSSTGTSVLVLLCISGWPPMSQATAPENRDWSVN